MKNQTLAPPPPNLLKKIKDIFKRLRGDDRFNVMENALLRTAANTGGIAYELRCLRILQSLQNHPDPIFEIPNVWHTASDKNAPPIRFYLPNAQYDLMQSEIVLKGNFFDIEIIETANAYFPDGANILDIGANIGNNTLYYALVRRAKKVYAFEPMADVFALLQENVRLNALENVVVLNNFAVGEKSGNASLLSRPRSNVGATEIKEDALGALKIKSLDELEYQNFFPEKIDFVKIDVEGFEAALLKGARAFLTAHKPAVQIESHTAKYAAMAEEMRVLGYREECAFGYADYIYLPK